MSKKFKLGLITLGAGVLGIVGLLSCPLPSQAASHNTIPTTLRGTWYQTNSTFNKHYKEVPAKGYWVMKLSRHTLTTWKINNRGKRTSKKWVVLASKYKYDYRHLYVTKEPLFNKHRYVWNLPDMNLQDVQPRGRKNTIGETDGWAFWTFNKTVAHQKYHLLGTYQRQGYVDIWSKKKVHHVFSYTTQSSKKLRTLGIKK
ncbi:hypothetical protein [Lactiplantibacillus songbeiensis]|uniref:Extracellular protein n=1 Tax=Lactiplantibacillus songbeiensis TaxID=2559920 RepID=A0ABW4C0A6_9LACO|nr:hypothetical protein [Lactiplantibacillus songbeiensis]